MKAIHRDTDRRKRPCASLIYCRSKQVADDLVMLWEQNRTRSEEDILSMQMDRMLGGWYGVDAYFKHYEPMCFDLGSEAYKIYTDEQLAQKDLIFRHFNKQHRDKALRRWRR